MQHDSPSVAPAPSSDASDTTRPALKFVIDGANVIYRPGATGMGAVDLDRLVVVVAALRDRFGGAEIRALIDSGTSMMLRRKGGRVATEIAEVLREGLMTQTPGCADPFLIQMALQDGYVVVSNDAFRDHPNASGVRRLPFTIIGSRVYFLDEDTARLLGTAASAPSGASRRRAGARRR